MWQANITNTKKEKMADQVWKKKTLQKTFFTSVLTIAREMPKKSKEKILTRCAI